MNTCQKAHKRGYSGRMSIAAEKVAEVLALPEQDRAFLARQLIASLDDTVDAGAETEWHEVIDRRSREIEEGKVSCRPVEQVVQDIRNKLQPKHPTSNNQHPMEGRNFNHG
jgi:putative addiction module component (TIGR02574 family)